MKKKLVLVLMFFCSTITNAASTNDVFWNGGTGDWMTQSNWTENTADGSKWAIPGWVGNGGSVPWNTYNTGESTLTNWNKGYAVIAGGTANITSVSHPDGQIERFYIGGTNGAALNISTEVTIYKGYLGSAAGETGTITQSAGNVTIAGDSTFGDSGNGVYNLSGGSLSMTGVLNFAYRGTMDFLQTGGSFSASNSAKNFTLGQYSSDSSRSTANITVSGSSTNFSTNVNSLIVGNYGDGTVNLNSGTMSLGSVNTYLGWKIGDTGKGTGAINVKGGNLTMSATGTDGIEVGYSGSGSITQTAGTITATTGSIRIAENSGSDGLVDVSGGSFNMNSGSLLVGVRGDGAVRISGGSFTVAGGDVQLGSYAGSTGSLTISAGSLSQSNTSKKTVIGEYGQGFFVQSGTADVSFDRVIIGHYEGSNSSYIISGGELDVSRYISGEYSLFKVIGSAANHIRTKKFEMDSINAVISIVLDAQGSTLIEATGVSSDSYFGALLAGSTLEVDTLSDFDGVANDVYDILWSATTIDTTGLVFSNLSETQFSWAVIDDTIRGGQVLQLTIIPEPATIGLLALGSLLFVRRKF